MGRGKCGSSHGHHHEEKLKKITVTLEEEQIEALKELSKEYSTALSQRWSVSAVLRLAVGDFFTKIGKIT